MIQAPLVSVLIPVYNSKDFINEALESVLNQTYNNIEIIIIDDGSTDGSYELISSYKDDRIKLFKNEKNQGLVKTLNIGLNHCQGSYIARIDSDDILDKSRIERQVQFLNKNSDYSLVGTWAILIGNTNEKYLQYPETNEKIRLTLGQHNCFIHSSVMIRKSTLTKYDLKFDDEYIHAEDYDLWTRIATIAKVHNIPEYLVYYRIHGNQVSQLFSNIQIENTEKIRKKYLSCFGFTDDQINLLKEGSTFRIDKNNLNKFITIVSINTFSNFTENNYFESFLRKKIRNIILESATISLSALKYIFLSKNPIFKFNWTIRQKIAILKKVVFYG